MTVLQDWTKTEQDEFGYEDFQALDDFPLAEELLPDEKKIIGQPESDFNKRLALLCTYLFEHMDERNEEWEKAWESLKNFADKGYPEASLGFAQICAGMAQQGDAAQLANADAYFEKAKENPYASQEMKNQIEERRKIADESFDQAYPDLTKASEAKDFTEGEYAHLDVQCRNLKDIALMGDKKALKNLETLAERGYPQAQENCGYLALEQGDIKKAMSYLDSLRNNHDAQIDGMPLQMKHIGDGLGSAISEKRKENAKNSSLLKTLEKGSKEGEKKENTVQLTGAIKRQYIGR